MSFVDEADVDVTEPASRKKRRPGRRRPPEGGRPAGDRQSLLLRRGGAALVGVIILILAVIGVRGCLGARQDRAVKDYVTEVSALTKESDAESRDFFDVLQNPGDLSEQELQNRVNSLRASAEELAKRAAGTDHPGDLDSAHGWLVDTLEFRRDGLAAIAANLGQALGDTNSKAATDRIAGQMQQFLASDVIYSQRVVPGIDKVLERLNLTGQAAPPKSQFLPDLGWLSPTTVAERLAQVQGGKQIAPGVHGTEVAAVTAKVGPSGTETELVRDGDTTLKAGPNTEFDVQVLNGSDVNEETDVGISVRLTGAGSVNFDRSISRIKPGETVTVRVPLTSTPKAGAARLEVDVQAVPGETVTDNNRGTYNITFN